MNGVVYNLADIVNSNDMDIPFIIIDNYNLYDNIAETNLGNLN